MDNNKQKGKKVLSHLFAIPTMARAWNSNKKLYFFWYSETTLTRMRCRHQETSQSFWKNVTATTFRPRVSEYSLRMSELSTLATCRYQIDPPRRALSFSLSRTSTHKLWFQMRTLFNFTVYLLILKPNPTILSLPLLSLA